MKRSRKLLLFVLLPAVVLVLAMAPVVLAYVWSGAPLNLNAGAISMNNIYIYVADDEAVEVSNAAKLTMTNSKLYSMSKTIDLSSRGALLAYGGAYVKLVGTEVYADGFTPPGPSGVLASGAGTQVDLSDCSVFSHGNASRGLNAQNGAKIYASNCDVTTWKSGGGEGVASGGPNGGTIVFANGSVHTLSPGSAAFYSTGKIKVENSTATADWSEAGRLDGLSYLTLEGTSLTSLHRNGVSFAKSPMGGTTPGVPDGTSQYQQTGGSLWAGMYLFYAPNSYAVIRLSGVTTHTGWGVLLTTVYDAFLGVAGDDPSRGSDVDLFATAQSLSGDVITDNASVVDISLLSGSALRGTLNGANEGQVNLTLDQSSKWVVTGTSYINALTLTPSKRVGGFSIRGGFNIANILSAGYTVYYNPVRSPGLGGRTYPLLGGGQLVPKAFINV